MSFILEDVAIGWKGPGYTAVPNILPRGHVFSVAGITYTWEKFIVVLITLPVLLAPASGSSRRRGRARRCARRPRTATPPR